MTRIETSSDGSIQIEIADSAGYCWGVERAIDLSVEAAKDTSRPVFTHGDLIHNTYTVNKLRDEHDINSVREVNAAPKGAALIIRAHGVPPQRGGPLWQPRAWVLWGGVGWGFFPNNEKGIECHVYYEFDSPRDHTMATQK